ncbi:MAG: hypothetical protein AAF696_37800, partial [Bacteroidota bacterium]
KNQIFITHEYNTMAVKLNKPEFIEKMIEEDSIGNIRLFMDSLYNNHIITLDSSELFPHNSKTEIFLKNSKTNNFYNM